MSGFEDFGAQQHLIVGGKPHVVQLLKQVLGIIGVKQIERDVDDVWSVNGLRSRVLIGAGGTHCPVARTTAPVRPAPPVGVQEIELHTDAAAVARTRIGKDGEPELVLFDDP